MNEQSEQSDEAASPSRPALTARSEARLAAGDTRGAGTDVCVSCGGEKAPSRVNSDKCAGCNNPRNTRPKATGRRPERKYVGALAVGFSDEMTEAIRAEATRRGVTMPEYIIEGMRRVLKKDTGWVPNPTADEMFPDEP